MARKGTYYLGRVLKTGALETKHIKAALRAPQTVVRYKRAWTFIDVKEQTDGQSLYFSGKLVKYDPNGEVSVIDPEQRKEHRQSEPNMTMAASPFVYIPDHAGISFLHVSNQIEYKKFMSRWSEVINASHNQILSQCEIDPIIDLRSFARKLKSLDGIYELSATVSPPNPLFGPLWKDLKEYLESRHSDRMTIEEDSGQQEPLATELAEHVEGILRQTPENAYEPETLPIGDAAILMAADGYGIGYVRGKQDDQFVIIRTSETVRNFSFDREPEPESLYKRTAEILEKIKQERHMEH